MDTALARRRALRASSTDAEKLLWGLLRSRQFLGLKFRRQHPVGPYIELLNTEGVVETLWRTLNQL